MPALGVSANRVQLADKLPPCFPGFFVGVATLKARCRMSGNLAPEDLAPEVAPLPARYLSSRVIL
jgi:hypothetical protein